MKLLNLFLLFFTVTFCLNAQLQTTYLGDGEYKFVSELPAEDLHFYIFDDGYYTFQHSPTHQFPSYANPANVKFYHTDPYTSDEPIEESVNPINTGIVNPAINTHVLDNMVTIERSWNLVNGQKDFFILKFENRLSLEPMSGCIEFHFDSLLVDIKSNEIFDDYGNNWVTYTDLLDSDYPGYKGKFVWDFEDLEFNEQRFVYLPANCLAPSMAKVKTRAVYKFENECGNTIPWDRYQDGSLPNMNTSQIYTYNSVVQNNPHDPNCIITNPKCLPEVGDEIVVVDYKIYFQNDGVDTVRNVQLNMAINAPVTNVNLVRASHDCEMHLEAPSNLPNGMIQFYFDKINLRGINEADSPLYEETIGWVEFQVCYDMEDFNNLLCAGSVVDIYFDLEPPVSVSNNICKEVSCGFIVSSPQGTGRPICQKNVDTVQIYNVPEEGSTIGFVNRPINNEIQDFAISPNPTYEFLSVDGNLDSDSEIRIFNPDGKLMLKIMSNDNINKVDVSQLNHGMFFISVMINGEAKVKPFVKY